MSLGTAPSKPSFFLLYWLKNLKGLIFKNQGTRVTGIWPLMRLFWLFSDTMTCTLLESWSFPSLYVIRIQGLFCMHADKNKLRTINLVVLIEPFRRTSIAAFGHSDQIGQKFSWCVGVPNDSSFLPELPLPVNQKFYTATIFAAKSNLTELPE